MTLISCRPSSVLVKFHTVVSFDGSLLYLQATTPGPSLISVLTGHNHWRLRLRTCYSICRTVRRWVWVSKIRDKTVLWCVFWISPILFIIINLRRTISWLWRQSVAIDRILDLSQIVFFCSKFPLIIKFAEFHEFFALLCMFGLGIHMVATVETPTTCVTVHNTWVRVVATTWWRLSSSFHKLCLWANCWTGILVWCWRIIVNLNRNDSARLFLSYLPYVLPFGYLNIFGGF